MVGSGAYLLTQESRDETGIVTSQKYNGYLDLVCTENDGVKTTYTRTAKGLVISEAVQASDDDTFSVTRG